MRDKTARYYAALGALCIPQTLPPCPTIKSVIRSLPQIKFMTFIKKLFVKPTLMSIETKVFPRLEERKMQWPNGEKW
jgi:hypothetical protein